MVEWRERGESGRRIGPRRCVNAVSGCVGLSRPRKYEKWEMCGKCLKRGDGKILSRGTTRGRWKVSCMNSNTADRATGEIGSEAQFLAEESGGKAERST